MKTFKEYINEKYIDGLKSELYFALSGYIPLSDWVHRDLEEDVDLVYRATDIDSLKYLSKGQGSRKQIPTFTKGSYGLSFGARQNTELLLELSGKSSIKLDFDASTVVDRNGKRWIKPILESTKEKFVKPMKKLILKKYPEVKQFLDSDMVMMMFVDKKFDTGKKKQEFIKFYFNTVKKFLNKEKIKDILNDIKNSSEFDTFSNDEVLLTNYKIKKAYIVKEGVSDTQHEEIEKLLKKYNIPFEGIVFRKQIEKIDITKGVLI